VYSLAIVNGTYFASGSYDFSIKIWNRNTFALKATFTGHTGWINKVVFIILNGYIASASYDSEIRIWDINTSAQKYLFDSSNGGHVDTVYTLASFDNGYLGMFFILLILYLLKYYTWILAEFFFFQKI
jgi:WD40 repeat protein